MKLLTISRMKVSDEFSVEIAVVTVFILHIRARSVDRYENHERKAKLDVDSWTSVYIERLIVFGCFRS